MLKLILNLVLVPNPYFGVNGAAIASVVNNFFAFFLSFLVLRKTISLNLSVMKFIIKPIIATASMCICSYAAYIVFAGMFSAKLATIIAIMVAVIVYILMVVILKIFEEEEITMIPFGPKIHKVLQSIGIYKKNED